MDVFSYAIIMVCAYTYIITNNEYQLLSFNPAPHILIFNFFCMSYLKSRLLMVGLPVFGKI
ncbi:hypothetical protein NVIRPANT_00164 [Pantoea sp. Nvir]|nr:hypothetical protein NVIRPANT_00164 [Pantoea sp. Nvir]